MDYSLAGGILEYRDQKEPYVRLFSFFEPSDYVNAYQEGSLYRGLLEFGFVPFASEQNGDVWLVDSASGPASPIYLMELSGWNGDRPNNRNGLVFACGNLGLLLASMGVSEASYYGSADGPHSIIWHKER